MMSNHNKNNNPLRISQESLDLEDIISDLNSEVSQNVTAQVTVNQNNKAQREAVKVEGGQQQKKQVVQSKSGTNNGGNNLSVQGKAAQPQPQGPKTVSKPAFNKENDSSLANQRTTETKASENNRYLHSVDSKQAIDIYSDNGVKTFQESEQCDQETNHGLRQQVPFYLKNGGTTQTVSDEEVEGFQRRLDTLLVNFRGETISEFMRTKKQLQTEQAQTLDAERRRFNTLIGVKQNEIEQLKEGLAQKTKESTELSTRCEVLALWAGKAKTLLRIKFLQNQAFQAFKQYRDFQKHTKRVLEHRLRQHKENLSRRAFLGWQKHYKAWKVIKNREDFEKAVKMELQHICAQYNKEIESLRDKLAEANQIVESEQRNKAMMQENLKKAFLKGVCALNFEAMHILNPNDQAAELDRALSGLTNVQSASFQGDTIPTQRSTLTQQQQNHFMTQLSPRSENENSRIEPDNPFVSLVSHPIEQIDYKKVESKDSMWKPAPIMGREINSQPVPSFTYNQPTITSQLKGAQQLQSNVVLSSHFSKLQSDNPTTIKTDSHGSQPLTQVRYEEDTTQIRVLPGNPTVIQNHFPSSLPDFVSNPTTQGVSEGGKTIVANNNSNKPVMTTAKVTSTLGQQKKPATATITSKKPLGK